MSEALVCEINEGTKKRRPVGRKAQLIRNQKYELFYLNFKSDVLYLRKIIIFKVFYFFQVY